MSKILVIGDVHAPWVSKPCLEFIFKMVKSFQPKYIVQVGDAVDFYSASRFPRSHFITPAEEYIEARKTLEDIFHYLKRIAPKSEIHLLKGNHCDRVIKRTKEVSPEQEHFVLKGLKEFFTFTDVITHHDSREEFVIDDILFTHGFLSGLGKHAQYYQRKVVCGHTHKGGTFFEQTYDGRTIWELNAGYCADPISKVMSYMPTKYSRSTLGFGMITNGFPQFVPFNK